jgi:hypothetical protein
MLCLLILAAALSLPGQAGPVVVNQNGLQGTTGFASNPHVLTSTSNFQPTITSNGVVANGIVSNGIISTGRVVPANTPVNCVPAPQCLYNNVVVPAGGYVPGNTQNYVVISPSTTTITTSSSSSYYVVPQQTTPAVYVPAPSPATTPAPATSPTATPSSPSPAAPSVPTDTTTPMPTVAPDANGDVHSPFSNSTLKVTGLTNGQIVHDPQTGQTFRVQTVAPAKTAVD